ncbi:MAG: sigma-70 family RNA polymerase sigma factor [Bacteroidota bacterium]
MELERYSEHLIGKVNQGDQRALNELFSLWYERVYNTAWKYFGEEETAMDMCQQTFIAIHKKIATLQDASKFKFWLYRTVINHCHMESRKRKSRANLKEKITQFRLTARQERPDEIYHRNERSKMVLDALQKIPEEQKTVIIMKEYEELTFREIAEMLGISEGTAKSRLYYGLKNLRKVLLNNNITKEYNYE